MEEKTPCLLIVLGSTKSKAKVLVSNKCLLKSRCGIGQKGTKLLKSLAHIILNFGDRAQADFQFFT